MKKSIRFLYGYIILCFVITAVVTTFALISYKKSNNLLQESVEDRLVSNIDVAFVAINVDLHKEIRETYSPAGFAGDTNAGRDDERYSQLVEKLAEISDSVGATYIYTMKFKGAGTDEFYFILDSDENIETRVYIGKTYQNLDKEEKDFFKQCLTDKESIFISEITDEWGTQYTACRALVDSNGEVEAILCVDISSDFIVRHNKTFFWTVLILEIILIAIYLVIGFLIYNLLKRNAIMQDKIEHMAYYDSLTTLPNRVALIEKLNSLMESLTNNNYKSYSIALYFIDVDNFKKVNDVDGHVTGDILLQEIAKFLLAHSDLKPLISKGKEFVARLGGDEFVLIQPIKEIEEIHKFANVLLSDFLKLKSDNKIMQKFNVSLSVGAAIYPKNADTVSSLLKAADTAMYYAKNHGKGTYAFYDDIEHKTE